MEPDLITELQTLGRYQYDYRPEDFIAKAKEVIIKAINEILKLEKGISEKEAEIRRYETERGDLIERLTMAIKEREQLRERLVEFDIIRNAELLELKHEIENLTTRTNKILEEKKVLESRYNELLPLAEEEKNRLLAMLEEFKKDLNTIKDERDAFEIRVKGLEEEKALLEINLMDSKRVDEDNRRLLQRLQEMTGELANVREERDRIEQALKDAEATIVTTKADVERLVTEKEGLLEKLKEAERAMAHLKFLIEEKESEMNRYAKENASVDSNKSGKEQKAFIRDKMETDIYEKALLEIEGVFRLISSGNTFALEPLIEISKDTVRVLKEDSGVFEKVFSQREDIISHSVNVGVIGIKIGLGLRYKEDELWIIGLGGFLHDLGMTRLPDGLITRPDRFLPEEVNLLKRHPEWSADILGDLGEIGKMISGFIVEEHERLHGGGYPKGIKDVDEYAQVIGIADVYEALTHPRPYRKRLHPMDAIKEIVRSEKDSFLKGILKVVIEGLRIFPSGSYVKLNTGEVGVVISNNEPFPYRPVLKILYDDEGRRIEKERIIDLKENYLCWISSPYEMEGEEIAEFSS